MAANQNQVTPPGVGPVSTKVRPTQKTDVSTPGGAYLKMKDTLDKINALLGGTTTMREAGETYLPRYSSETVGNYRTRLKRSTLFGYYRKAVQALAGKPFSKELQVNNLDPKLLPLLENADLQGNSLHVFAQQVFTEAMGKGLTHILVDYPEVDVDSAAEEIALAPRPYFVHIKPENVISGFVEYENGKEIITHLRIATTEIEREGYGEREVERIRVFEPGRFEVHEKHGKTWELVEEGPVKLSYVPFLTFYAERKEFLVGNPSLEDVADKNIEHWQSASDQRHVLTVARFPMLAAKGVSLKEGEVVRVGPYEMLFSENPQSEFYYVEHTGQAIQSGNTDLENIKAEMAALALDMLVPRPGRTTATEKSINAAESHSVVQMMALNFQDLLEQALVVAGDWIGVPPEACGDVRLNTAFGLSGLDAKALEALILAYNTGVLTPLAFLQELRRRDILDQDLDIEELADKAEAKMLADEQAAKLAEKMKAEKAANVAVKPAPAVPGQQSVTDA